MQKNVGTIDRGLRAIAGLAIIGAGLYTNSWWGAIGLVFVTTGLIGWCPAYCPLKISTAE